MLPKHERTKRIAILAYVIIVSLLLWCMSQADMTSADLRGLTRFAIFFWAGVSAAHYFTVLMQTPATPENWHLWKALSVRLLLATVVIGGTVLIIIGVAALASLWKAPALSTFLVILAIFAVGVWLSVGQAERFRTVAHELSSNQSQP